MVLEDKFGFLQLSTEVEMMLWEVHCYVDIVSHFIFISIASSFLLILYQSALLHKNLRRILMSFTIACCMGATVKFIAHFFLLTRPDRRHGGLIIAKVLWQLCALTSCSHMDLIAFERLLATMRSTTYEKESHPRILVFSVFLSWTLSLLLVLMVYLFELHTITDTEVQIVTVVCLFFTIAAITIISVVHYLNLKDWKNRRGVMDITESYQVHEIVKTSRFINRVFIVFSILFFVNILILVAYDSIHVNGVSLLCDVSFDIVSSLPTALIPLIVINGDERLYRRVTQTLRKCIRTKTTTVTMPMVLRTLDGMPMNIETKYHEQTHFKQLEDAWK